MKKSIHLAGMAAVAALSAAASPVLAATLHKDPARTDLATIKNLPAQNGAKDTEEIDLGQVVEKFLNSLSRNLFGIGGPLSRAADASDYVSREAATTADKRVRVASTLHAEYLTRKMALNGDQIAFWPNDTNPTHLFVAIELSRTSSTSPKGQNPSLQRIDLATGEVATVLHGLTRADGIRTTPWGTLLISEENGGDGRAYEVIDPLNVTDEWVFDRATGDIRTTIGGSDKSTHIVQRPRLGSLSWEGIVILENGVLYNADELRPDNGNEGGAIFKFVPATLRTPGTGTIGDLAQSPFVDGKLYALTVGSGAGETGQGAQRGIGRWIGPADWDDVTNPNDKTTRQWARDNNATGFYRPEDLDQDPTYTGTGVKFYWANTGNETSQHYGEVLSLVDPDPASIASTPNVQSFINNSFRFVMPDNVEVQPKTGIVYVCEDNESGYGEIFACLPDGNDADTLSDGCVSIYNTVDPNAEPTGFIFDSTGQTAYVIVQHGEQFDSLRDFSSNIVDGATDDLLKITGFETAGVPGKFESWTADWFIRNNRK